MTEDDWHIYIEDLREQGIGENDDGDHDDINPGICWDCRYACEADCHYYGKVPKTRHGDNRHRRWKLEGLNTANCGKKTCKHHSPFTPEEVWKGEELESFINGFDFMDDDGDLLVGIHAPPPMNPGESWADYYARLVGRTLDQAWQAHKIQYEAEHPGIIL